MTTKEGCGFVKNASKRLLSFALCLVLLVGLFPPLSARAEDSGQSGMESFADYRMESVGTLGRTFANSMNAQMEAEAEESAKNQISTVEIVEEKVRVGYSATESAELVVAFYADPGAEDAPVLQLLATVTGEAEPEHTTASPSTAWT